MIKFQSFLIEMFKNNNEMHNSPGMELQGTCAKKCSIETKKDPDP